MSCSTQATRTQAGRAAFQSGIVAEVHDCVRRVADPPHPSRDRQFREARARLRLGAALLLVCRAMSERRAHPIAFLFLIFPFGAMGGYLTVALAYLLSKAGLGVGAIAGLVAISYIPHTWKFAWAPIADTTLNRRTWYVIASVASAAGMWLMGALPATPANVPLLSAIVLVANV